MFINNHSAEDEDRREEEEQSLEEFAQDCGDDESVWGYDGDGW